MTQAQFAERLLVSRDYLSQIENGREPSPRLVQQIELLDQVGLPSLHADSVPTESALAEDQAPYGKPTILAREIERVVNDAIQSAGGDLNRLGWILEQAKAHLSPLSHWSNHHEMVRQAQAMATQRQEQRNRRGASASGTEG